MFVADYINKRIHIYTDDAQFQGYFFQSPVDTTLSFVAPANANFDQFNNLWVADFGGWS